jgi:hypothetical protein
LPFFLLVYSFGGGMQLLLERGQSDLFTGLLCWSAVLLSLQGRWFLAMFLATWGTMIKGYPIVFLPGIGVLGLTRAHWKGTILGGFAAFLVFLAPVIRHLPDAKAAMASRTDMFWPVWFNHGFRNLVYFYWPNSADKGASYLTYFALAMTALCWFQAWRARESVERAAWLVLFTMCALGTMLGYSKLSCSYNNIIVIPGMALFAVHQRLLLGFTGAPRRTEWVLGPVIALAVWALLIVKYNSETFPVGAVGLLSIITLAGTLAAVKLGIALYRQRTSTAPEVPAAVPSSSESVT